MWDAHKYQNHHKYQHLWQCSANVVVLSLWVMTSMLTFLGLPEELYLIYLGSIGNYSLKVKQYMFWKF